MTDWPRDYHPIDDGEIDYSRTVSLYPHQAGRTDDLIEWAGGATVVTVNGGPCLILSTTRPVASRLVGLGDAVVDDGEHSVTAVPGGEISAHYWPADTAAGLPPVD